MSHDTTASTPGRPARQRAGVFDIRSTIGLLLGIYGVILLVTGLVSTAEAEAPGRTAAIDVNIWTGAGLLVAALVFVVWARLRPVVVPAEQPEHDSGDSPH